MYIVQMACRLFCAHPGKERSFEMKFTIQKAPVFERIAAALLDFILLLIVTTGIMLAISAITGYQKQADKLDAYANKYGVSLELTEEEYNKFTKEEKEIYDAKFEAFSTDEDVMRVYSIMSNLMILIPSLAIFFAYLLLEFIVPLILKNGQTVGKKIMSLGVIRIDGVKASPFILFVRTLIGKYTVETMIPLMLLVLNGIFGFMGIVVVALMVILQIVLMIVTKYRTVIHDSFAQSVVVHLPTQLVFNDAKELMDYKTRLAAEEAAKADY